METGNKLKNATTASLYDGGGDPSKRPFVFYHFKNPETGKMQRFKVYKGFAQCKTLEEIQQYGLKLVKKINRQLRNRYDPFKPKSVIYSEVEPSKEVIKHTVIPIEIHLQKALDRRESELRSSTYQSCKAQLKVFIQWLKKNGLHGSPIEVFTDIHAKDFLHYIKTDLQRHNTTRNQYRVNLKHLFSLLKEREIIEKNPFDKTRKLYTVKTSKKPYNKQQQNLLKNYISSVNSELWLGVQFIYYCFIRPNELRQLKLEDIDLEQGRIFVRGEIAKNKKNQHVRIEKPLLELLLKKQLQEYPKNYFLFGKDGKPGIKGHGKNYFGSRHLQILRKLNFSNSYCLYSWKHTGAVNAVKNGVNLEYLRLQMRHHSLDQTTEYLKSLGVMDDDFSNNQIPEL